MKSLIIALDSKNGYSKDKKIPWLNEPWAKTDLQRFKEVTLGCNVVMGRNTYMEINERNKNLLPGRHCYVISKNVQDPRVIIIDDLNALSDYVVIGGAKLFEEALNHVSKIYYTRINKDYQCDLFFQLPDWHIVYEQQVDQLIFGLMVR